MQHIIKALTEERNRLDKAISILEGSPESPDVTRKAGKRKLSPEARRRIARAVKARWNAAKASGRKHL